MSLPPLWFILLLLVTPWPFGMNRRGRRVPWVTYTLIGLNVLVYGLTGPDAFQRWGLIPGFPGSAGHEVLTMFTSLFLHVDLLHLFGNMLFLWVFGPHVEESLGRLTFVGLYLGGGVTSGLLHIAVVTLRAPGSEAAVQPLVGASGAISAILAPFALRYHRAHLRLFWLPGLFLRKGWGRLEVPAVTGLALWLLQNLAGGIRFLVTYQSGVAYWAHIGGFVFGLVAAELTSLFREGRQDYLLQDARAAAARGYEALTVAVQKYRAFLDHDPDNAAVRAELARLLASRAGAPEHEGKEDRLEASLEYLASVRLLAKRGDLSAAVRCFAEAQALGLPLLLTSRERLRLAGAAIENGYAAVAVSLLRALVTETPDAPEDEMARLKLAPLLLPDHPADVQALLQSFLEKYPHSPWTHRARALRDEAVRLADSFAKQMEN